MPQLTLTFDEQECRQTPLYEVHDWLKEWEHHQLMANIMHNNLPGHRNSQSFQFIDSNTRLVLKHTSSFLCFVIASILRQTRISL